MFKAQLLAIVSVIRREFLFVVNDKSISSILLVAPLFFGIFYGTVYINKGEHDVPVAVLNLDNTQYSRDYIRAMNATEVVAIVKEIENYSSIEELIQSGEIQAAVVIPENFYLSLTQGEKTNIKLYLNNLRFLSSNDINKAVTSVNLEAIKQLRLEMFKRKGYTSGEAEILAEPIALGVHTLFNSSETYGDFLLPGMLILILQQTLLIAMAQSIAKEKEQGSLKELWRTSGNSSLIALTGKGIFYLIISMCYVIFYYGFIFAILDVPFVGSLWLLIGITIIFLMATISLGFLLSSLFKRKLHALQLMAFSTYVFFFLSGYSWPNEGLPTVLKYLSQIFPLTPFLKIFISVVSMGGEIAHITDGLIHLIILFFILSTLAYTRLRYLFLKDG